MIGEGRGNGYEKREVQKLGKRMGMEWKRYIRNEGMEAMLTSAKIKASMGGHDKAGGRKWLWRCFFARMNVQIELALPRRRESHRDLSPTSS